MQQRHEMAMLERAASLKERPNEILNFVLVTSYAQRSRRCVQARRGLSLSTLCAAAHLRPRCVVVCSKSAPRRVVNDDQKHGISILAGSSILKWKKFV